MVFTFTTESFEILPFVAILVMEFVGNKLGILVGADEFGFKLPFGRESWSCLGVEGKVSSNSLISLLSFLPFFVAVFKLIPL